MIKLSNKYSNRSKRFRIVEYTIVGLFSLMMLFSIIPLFVHDTYEVDLLYENDTTETVTTRVGYGNIPRLDSDKPCLTTIDGVRCDIVKMSNMRKID